MPLTHSLIDTLKSIIYNVQSDLDKKEIYNE